ncbi:MAG: PDZ domain-containing protein [Alistipes sp.]|nr:PDZ domain-containing protein [Alistipes sp.]
MSKVWSEIKYNFAYADAIDFDADSVYRYYLPMVMRTRNDVDFMDLLRRFMAAFDDGHTNVGYPSYNWSRINDYAPIRAKEIDGRYYLSYVSEWSKLDSLAIGAELVEVDGIPVQEYVRKHYFPLFPGPERTKAFRVTDNYLCTGRIGSLFRGTIRQRNGQSVHFKMRTDERRLYRKKTKKEPREWTWTDFYKSRKENVTVEFLSPDSIAWMDIRLFDEDDIPTIRRHFEQIRNRARGLILDLRYCNGGSSIVGDSLLHHIIDADYLLIGKAMTRINNGYGRAQGNWQPQYEAFYRDRAYEMLPADTLRIDRSQILRMPIVILTGKRTVSAAETFLIQLMELPDRPRVIGQQTAGTTGSPLIVDLPHNAWVRICTLQHLYPISGKPFGKEGILPDEIIAPTLEDYLTGRDAVLERALKIIDPQ